MAGSFLQRRGIRRAHVWDPPTALDKFLDGPVHVLVAALFALLVRLRGTPSVLVSPAPGSTEASTAVRVVCISDTHDQKVPVPDGDLLIHAGDLTDAGTVADIQKQLDWLASLPHRHKVVIAGNHDSYFDPSSRPEADRKSGAAPELKGGLRYLEDDLVSLDFEPQGRTLNVYGSPHIPQCGGSNFAFQYPRQLHPWDHKIPMETDILVTHGPPRYHLDLNLGCAGLLEEVWRVRPKLHVFGHVHAGHGRQAVFFDECQRAYERLMARPRRGPIRDLMLPNVRWLDALKVLLHGVNAVLFKWLMQGPGPNSASLMINAAQMYRSTGKMGNKAHVVDL